MLLPLTAAAGASAQQTTDASRLESLIAVTQSGSALGVDLAFPREWCLSLRPDEKHNEWYIEDPLLGGLRDFRVRNAIAVPFTFEGYGNARIGSIVIGYHVTGDAGARRGAIHGLRPPGNGATIECGLGSVILAAAPLAIRMVPDENSIARVTSMDPAPEYRWWYVHDRPIRVKLIMVIPVEYELDHRLVAGSIVIGFAVGP
jgi:hypothetical protein